MTTPRRERHQNRATAPTAGPKTPVEMSEPYDPPDPQDRWPVGRAAYLIVVDQLRDWQPGRHSPSLAELLETRPIGPANPSPTRKPNHDPDRRTTPMPLTITDELITSDGTAHTARPIDGHPDAWQVTWLPGQIISRNGAITAMVLAELASRDLHPGHRRWPHISGWAAELGLTAPVAIALASEPPWERTTDREPAASPPDREAAGP